MTYRNLVSAAVAAALGFGLSEANAGEVPASDNALDEVIVTGVLSGTRLQDAPIALTTVSGEEISRQVPISGADLLRSVPGVFVNSSLGEIRNVVFSRGVSANSLDAAAGYYYVSLQEDGLPVTNVTYINYGPDYFYRPDVTLGRLEALRGGTANLTGPNAPGGIFNYISKTGATDPGFEVRARYGMEGDFSNPFYRADVYAGGRIGDGGWSYSVGGFYRQSEGARYPGYDLNNGGQIKANLGFDYGNGSLLLYGKYLDDNNGWFEFLPAKNFNSPKLVSGIGSDWSFLPPANPHTGTIDGGLTSASWDGSNVVNSKSKALGLKWNHDLGNGWSFDNNIKYMQNSTDWNTGAVIFPVPLTDPFTYILVGGLSGELFGSIPAMIGGTPAVYTFRDHATSNVLARVNVTFNPAAPILPFNYNVVTNNLPNQQVLGNGILTQAQLNQQNDTTEWMDQLSVTKKLETMSFTFGAFFARSSLEASGGGTGFGLSPIDNQPQLLDVTLALPGGTVQQVTNSASVGALGDVTFATPNDAVQKQMSLFFGNTWEFAPSWSVDWGVRWEKLDVSGNNTPNVIPANQPPGGPDGNPDTLYDNNFNVGAPQLHYSKNVDFFNYTAAVMKKFSDRQAAYVRYSNGKKAPDLGFFQGLNTPFLIATQEADPQRIEQLELGYRVMGDRYTLSASPFYSKLSNVGSVSAFQDQTGAPYTRPALFSEIHTIGIELEGTFRFGQYFDASSAVTLQDPQSKDFRVWIHDSVTNDPANDVIVATPDGLADNNPRILANTTLNFHANEQWAAFVTWQYTGSRAANRFRTFYLPGFSQFNLGANWMPTEKLTVSVNINNVLDAEGVMSWARGGSFLAALDRQGFSPADRAADENQTFSILTTQPRSGFLSVSYRFN
jgi:iron complex outermembrane recepter protein